MNDIYVPRQLHPPEDIYRTSDDMALLCTLRILEMKREFDRLTPELSEDLQSTPTAEEMEPEVEREDSINKEIAEPQVSHLLLLRFWRSRHCLVAFDNLIGRYVVHQMGLTFILQSSSQDPGNG